MTKSQNAAKFVESAVANVFAYYGLQTKLTNWINNASSSVVFIGSAWKPVGTVLPCTLQFVSGAEFQVHVRMQWASAVLWWEDSWCITLDDSLFDWSRVSSPWLGEVLENVLGWLGFSSAGFPTHNDWLVTPERSHVAIRLVGCKHQSACDCNSQLFLETDIGALASDDVLLVYACREFSNTTRV